MQNDTDAPPTPSPCPACRQFALPEEMETAAYCKACWWDTLATSLLTHRGLYLPAYLVELTTATQQGPETVHPGHIHSVASDLTYKAAALRRTMIARAKAMKAENEAARRQGGS